MTEQIPRRNPGMPVLPPPQKKNAFDRAEKNWSWKLIILVFVQTLQKKNTKNQKQKNLLSTQRAEQLFKFSIFITTFLCGKTTKPLESFQSLSLAICWLPSSIQFPNAQRKMEYTFQALIYLHFLFHVTIVKSVYNFCSTHCSLSCKKPSKWTLDDCNGL